MSDRNWEELREELKSGELKMTVRELEPLLQRAAEMAVQAYGVQLGQLHRLITDLDKRVRALEATRHRSVDRR